MRAFGELLMKYVRSARVGPCVQLIGDLISGPSIVDLQHQHNRATFGITSEIIAVAILSRWADTCTCSAIATSNWACEVKDFPA
jgi:hypothetical protein